MAECVVNDSSVSKVINTYTQVEKKLSVSAVRKFKKLRARRDRRKRNKLNYFKHKHTKVASKQKSSSTAAYTDCPEMNVNCTTQLVPPIPEVSSWQNQHQLAYWKSRAKALEYENRMLHQHLRNVYAKQTQDYVDYLKEHPEEVENQEESPFEDNNVENIPGTDQASNK